MAAYRQVYDSRHLQADYQEPGSVLEPYVRQSSIGYLYFFTSDYLRYLRKKTICNPLAHTTWKCTTLTCEVPNFFYLTEGLHCTCIFRTCVFNPCRFVLAFSVHAFSILAKCSVSYLPFPYLRFPVLAFSAPPSHWHLSLAKNKIWTVWWEALCWWEVWSPDPLLNPALVATSGDRGPGPSKDVLNVKKIIINVNKRVYYKKIASVDNKRWHSQTATRAYKVNTDINNKRLLHLWTPVAATRGDLPVRFSQIRWEFSGSTFLRLLWFHADTVAKIDGTFWTPNTKIHSWPRLRSQHKTDVTSATLSCDKIAPSATAHVATTETTNRVNEHGFCATFSLLRIYTSHFIFRWGESLKL